MRRLTNSLLLLMLMFMFFGMASAQGTKTVAVKVSGVTQQMNNKEYYVHIVEPGQTLFSIARAYGLKYYDAVIKTDIHLMKVGDTVWLPKNEYSVSAVSKAASDAVASATSVHYVKVDAGQTLYGLSKAYGVTVDQIVEANPELRNEKLKAGQMLKIPARETSADAEQKRLAEQRAAEERRLAEQKAAEEKRLAEQKAEEKRLAEQKAAEEKHVAEQKAAEERRLAEQKAKEKRLAEQKATEEKHIVEQNVAVQPTDVELLTGIRPPATPKPAVNPYPFTEVPADFPAGQAPYYNFSTTSAFNYQVRDMQSKEKVFVTVIMPLNLSKINEISTSKFDIEQRGKKEYKVFEFIQFYEGILMALDELQAMGCNVVLNVVDLVSDKDEEIVEAFNSHSVGNSDLIVALLVKKPFATVAELAKQHQVFVINPFSSRGDVVKDNPYVVKYMPSVEGTVKGMLDIMASKHRDGHLYLLHSNNKNPNSEERLFLDEFQRQLSERTSIRYTLFDWTVNGKLVSTLKSTDDNVIVSLYDQDKNKNTVYVTTLLNRLSSLNTHVPVLMTATNYLQEYPNIDFEQLQHLNYTTVTMGYLDYGNSSHKKFIDTYKDKFRTEPNTLYAGVAHDIMLYFVSALSQQGAEFWRNPQKFRAPAGMLFPFSLKQSSSTGGYENQSPDIYQMSHFKLNKVKF